MLPLPIVRRSMPFNQRAITACRAAQPRVLSLASHCFRGVAKSFEHLRISRSRTTNPWTRGLPRRLIEKPSMTYVIAEPCIGTKDTACVEVCPVDCIHPVKDAPDFAKHEMLYINPDECIDCGACVPECPVDAIFDEPELPEKWVRFTKINADWFKANR